MNNKNQDGGIHGEIPKGFVVGSEISAGQNLLNPSKILATGIFSPQRGSRQESWQ